MGDAISPLEGWVGSTKVRGVSEQEAGFSCVCRDPNWVPKDLPVLV